MCYLKRTNSRIVIVPGGRGAHLFHPPALTSRGRLSLPQATLCWPPVRRWDYCLAVSKTTCGSQPVSARGRNFFTMVMGKVKLGVSDLYVSRYGLGSMTFGVQNTEEEAYVGLGLPLAFSALQACLYSCSCVPLVCCFLYGFCGTCASLLVGLRCADLHGYVCMSVRFLTGDWHCVLGLRTRICCGLFLSMLCWCRWALRWLGVGVRSWSGRRWLGAGLRCSTTRSAGELTSSTLQKVRPSCAALEPLTLRVPGCQPFVSRCPCRG